MNNDGSAGLILLILVAIPYFIPSIVAISRGMHNKGSIIVVNVFLGWTLIGWVVALAMACGGKKSVDAGTLTYTPPPSNLPPPNSGFDLHYCVICGMELVQVGQSTKKGAYGWCVICKKNRSARL
jgi:hypothetical protein